MPSQNVLTPGPKASVVDDEPEFPYASDSAYRAFDMELDDDSGREDRPIKADFNEDDDVDMNMDLDAPFASADTKPKPEPPSSPPGPDLPSAANPAGDIEEESGWKSLNSLVAFRQASVAIAEDYFKKQGVKLSKGRPTKELELKDAAAKNAYRKGVEDAKRTDIQEEEDGKVDNQIRFRLSRRFRRRLQPFLLDGTTCAKK